MAIGGPENLHYRLTITAFTFYLLPLTDYTVALELHRMGHLPVMGEWFALPLIEEAGSQKIGDKVFNEIFHPIAIRLIDHCDAILRIGGPSAGADEMVKVGKLKNKIIFLNKEQIPDVL
jgi:hypothetical protein